MLRLIGAAMLILSCGGAGICVTAGLRQKISALDNARRVLRRMQTEVCLHRRSLPEVLDAIRREFPGYASEGCGAALEDRPFSALWENCVAAFSLPEQAETALKTLGKELTDGEAPETAFRTCQEELVAEKEALQTRLETRGKVYIATGFAAGCMLVIAVI